MTKDLIEARIKELETAREQLKANFIAVEGALQEAKHWLVKVETPPQEEKKKK